VSLNSSVSKILSMINLYVSATASHVSGSNFGLAMVVWYQYSNLALGLQLSSNHPLFSCAYCSIASSNLMI